MKPQEIHNKLERNGRFDVLTMGNINTTIFWIVMLCSLVDIPTFWMKVLPAFYSTLKTRGGNGGRYGQSGLLSSSKPVFWKLIPVP
jgi:hypothetical protein